MREYASIKEMLITIIKNISVRQGDGRWGRGVKVRVCIAILVKIVYSFV